MDGLKLKQVALQHLFVACDGGNLSEAMWLKVEISAIDAALGE